MYNTKGWINTNELISNWYWHAELKTVGLAQNFKNLYIQNPYKKSIMGFLYAAFYFPLKFNEFSCAKGSNSKCIKVVRFKRKNPLFSKINKYLIIPRNMLNFYHRFTLIQRKLIIHQNYFLELIPSVSTFLK